MTTAFRVECDCGYSKTTRTEGLAAYGLRKHSCERWQQITERRRRGDEIRAKHAANRHPKLCPHNTTHVHGTHACYVLDRCRCLPCITSNRSYERNRVRQNAYGRPPYIDAEPARQHARTLMAQGIGWKRIAQAAGVPYGTMTKLIYGDPKRNLAPSKRVRPATAEKVLSVTVEVADGQIVDAAETRELVKAIVARGYSLTWIVRQVGLTNQALLYRQHVKVGTARAIRSLADECAVLPGGHPRALAMAGRNGWTADALWADVCDPTEPVDDVDEVAVRRFLDGDDVKLNRAEKWHGYLLLLRRGATHNQAALRLRLSGDYAKKYRDRYDVAALSEVRGAIPHTTDKKAG